jgi:hypothetical protein
MKEQITETGRTIEELGTSQGFVGLEDLVDAHNAAVGSDYTAEELADWPRPGFGSDLGALLDFSEEERLRLVGAV